MKKLFQLILVLILCAGVGLGISYFLAPEGEKHLLLLIEKDTTIFPVIIGGGCYLIHLLTKLGESEGKNKNKLGSKTKEGKELSQYFDSRWVTEKELKT